ncbi:MAG: hypothetical protein R2755_22085 [Acidimicrobiales bacterium]
MELAARAGELVARATEALLDGDAAATALLAADDELAEVQSQRIEQLLPTPGAAANPVAADLRTLAAGSASTASCCAGELATSIAGRRAARWCGAAASPSRG